MIASVYVAVALLIAVHECLRRRRVLVDFLTVFNAFFVFTYILPALAFLLLSEHVGSWRFLSLYPEAARSGIVAVAIVAGYLALALGFTVGNARQMDTVTQLGFKFGERTQSYAVFGYFAVCAAAFVIYAYGHGGVVELLLSGKEIRTQRQHAGALQYFGYFASGLSLCTLLFYSLTRGSRYRGIRRLALIMFAVSFVAALVYAVGTAGRGNIGFVFLILVITWLNLDERGLTYKKVVGIGIFGLLVFLLIVYGKSALWTLGYLSSGPQAYMDAFLEHRAWYGATGTGNDLSDIAVSLLSNKDHPIVSLYLALHQPEVYEAPRLFLDWPRAVLEVVPGITQPDFVVSQTPSALNRNYLQADGYVPPGWIAMKVINGGFAWLVGGSAVAGLVGGYMNKTFSLSWHSSPLMPGLFTFAAFFWKDSLVGPDPFMVIIPNLPTLLLLLFLGWMLVVRVRRAPSVKVALP